MENDELFQIKTDIADLRANVNTIKSDISEMKHSVSGAMEKISDSSVRMATVLEKLNHNIEEHKIIHKRIDDQKINIEYIEDDVETLKTTCKICQETTKIRSQTEQNSPWTLAKNKAIEYLTIGIVLLIFFIMYINLDRFVKSYFPVADLPEQTDVNQHHKPKR